MEAVYPPAQVAAYDSSFSGASPPATRWTRLATRATSGPAVTLDMHKTIKMFKHLNSFLRHCIQSLHRGVFIPIASYMTNTTIIRVSKGIHNIAFYSVAWYISHPGAQIIVLRPQETFCIVLILSSIVNWKKWCLRAAERSLLWSDLRHICVKHSASKYWWL